MTRSDAVRVAYSALDKLHQSGVQGRPHDIVAILEALGVIELEPDDRFAMKEQDLIEILRGRGYVVEKR
jgi:hypothetical protein